MRSGLIRDPADWAREQGWTTRRQNEHTAEMIDSLIAAIEGSMGDDPGANMWIAHLQKIRKRLVFARKPVRRAERSPYADQVS